MFPVESIIVKSLIKASADGCKAGTKRRWSHDKELQLATELAERADPLPVIAARWGVSYAYIRRIACGDRRPRVAEMVRTITVESIDRAKFMAIAALCDAVKVIIDIMNDSTLRPDARCRAALDIFSIALGKPERARGICNDQEPEPNVVNLTDIIKSKQNMPAERRRALGLDKREAAYGESLSTNNLAAG